MYHAVIGLEVHAQLKTQTKLFCSCKVETGVESNTNVCPVCLAMPGSLPVPNGRAVELAIRLGLALNCEIDPLPMWTRKNYFYPDLPKGYQITQTGGIPLYDHPVCKNGYLEIQKASGEVKRIGITRIHMEEDAGKLVHDFTPSHSHFDANRCGTPLCEIVSEPDLRDPEEATLYLQKLKQILEYTDVCDANMELGNLRCDANISIRPTETSPFGTRVEIKNLNSFSNVAKAIQTEIDLQSITLDAGGEVIQATKRFDAGTSKTSIIRTKEDAHDYRYFPEPDMVRLVITPEMIAQAKSELPELPDARRARFVESYQLSAYDAEVLTIEKSLADYFDTAAAASENPKMVANWISSELLRELREVQMDFSACKIQPAQLAKLVNLIHSGTISGKIGKTVFAEMWATGKEPEQVIKEKDLVQISDEGAIQAMIQEILDANPDQLAEFRSGKAKVRGFFVGLVMQKTKGKANPATVNKLLDQCLAG
jgi:aspartyl-tRNA(Asn)/glutamyl-tRNA(Gln) amidotransferase subunit B